MPSARPLMPRVSGCVCCTATPLPSRRVLQVPAGAAGAADGVFGRHKSLSSRRRWRSLKTMTWSRHSQADAADHALRERVLPSTPRRGEDLSDTHVLDSVLEGWPVHLVTIADQIPRNVLPGERLGHLLGGPLRGRVLGDVEVHDPASGVGEHDEDEEDPEPDRGDDEEVDGREVFDVAP